MPQKRVVVITGAGSGIGRATAVKFAREGAQVVVADLNAAGAEETVGVIRASGGEAVVARTDVTKYAEVEALVELAVTTYHRIDVMFNNAGIARNRPFIDQDLADYHDVINVNQHGVVYGVRAAARKMRDLKIQGVIINTASVFGYVASRGTFGYHAAKGAVNMISKAGALELAPYGIRVFGIAPGGVDTPLIRPLKDAGLSQQMQALHMRNELIAPSAIADAVYLLSLPEASVINGSTVMLDDGFAAFKV